MNKTKDYPHSEKLTQAYWYSRSENEVTAYMEGFDDSNKDLIKQLRERLEGEKRYRHPVGYSANKREKRAFEIGIQRAIKLLEEEMND